MRFDDEAKRSILAADHHRLANYEWMGNDALRSAPTPDHYLPILYVPALQLDGDEATFPVSGFDEGSISMTTVQIG